MKKTLSLLTLVFSFMLFAQTCGFDEVQSDLERQFPENKRNREDAEAKLLSMNVRSYLDKVGATSKGAQYTGKIYEVPVVIHYITSSASANDKFKLTDAQLTKWIDDCNKMYATTYGNGFYTEGPNITDGNVIPFKLVLAKRTPSCSPTTGIVRYNGSSLPGYDDYGVKRNGTGGVTTTQVKSIAPHWPEADYFNIYVVTTFDGDQTTYGLMGWCGLPTNTNSSYESFMKSRVVTNLHSTTLAHEFGHGMGLWHTFNGASGTDCPANGNCLKDNDLVCDTEAGKSLLGASPFPTNSTINPCTGVNYAGVQYNMMNYTSYPRKFTAGQRDRAISVFMQYRGNLTTSNGGKAPGSTEGGSVKASSCVPSGITNSGNWGGGPLRVQLGNIDNATEPYRTDNGLFYVDYNSSCSEGDTFSDISTAQNSLKVTIGTNPQFIKAYIDYNNNGVFEASELIGASSTPVSIANSPYEIKFTPPATALRNTVLRMRVIADGANINACDKVTIGQMEDYAVRLRTSLATVETSADSGDQLVFVKSENKLKLNSANKNGFGDYEIYDMNGKIIQKGKAQKEITLKMQLPKGVYIIKHEAKSDKFIN